MYDLFADIGYKSLNKAGEQLCGDHVEIVRHTDGLVVAVLADGLGSGVKANILSTLTAKIISTMMADSMDIEQCLPTITATLPISPEHNVAYSTFTILRVSANGEAEIIQYDNPRAILLRNGVPTAYESSKVTADGKVISRSKLRLTENDAVVLLSDGVLHAAESRALNYAWGEGAVCEFLQTMYDPELTSKTICTLLIDECGKLYGTDPGDDATALMVKMKRRESANVLFGPPTKPEDVQRMMALFFGKRGLHIVCGGTTSDLAAAYLKKPLVPDAPLCTGPAVPPTARIEGVDLVTEGVITVNQVLTYAKDYADKNALYSHWGYQKDGASKIARILFENATDIQFMVGLAVNEAYTNKAPDGTHFKALLIEELSHCLEGMGKHVRISYF